MSFTRDLNVKNYFGIEASKPGKLNPGDTYRTIDTDKFYRANSNGELEETGGGSGSQPYTNLVGTEILLDNTAGNYMNTNAPNPTDTYTLGALVAGGNAKLPIDTTGKTEFPNIIGPTTETRSDKFYPSANYDMYVESDDGLTVEYYFILVDIIDEPIEYKDWSGQVIFPATTPTWMTWQQSGRNSGDPMNENLGTGPDPVIPWDNKGWGFFKAGTKFHSLRITGTENSSNVTEVYVHMATSFGDFDTGYTQGEGNTVEEIIGKTAIGLPAGNRAQKTYNISLSGYTLPQDSYVLLSIQADVDATQRTGDYEIEISFTRP